MWAYLEGDSDYPLGGGPAAAAITAAIPRIAYDEFAGALSSMMQAPRSFSLALSRSLALSASLSLSLARIAYDEFAGALSSMMQATNCQYMIHILLYNILLYYCMNILLLYLIYIL